MRLKPHTYRRLAWVACWTVPVKDPDILFCFEKLRPAEDELQCLNNLLSLYKALLERYPDVDFTSKTTESLKNWEILRKDEDKSIQTLTILFPTQSSLATFLRQFQDIFFITEIIKYCADGINKIFASGQAIPAASDGVLNPEMNNNLGEGLYCSMLSCFCGPSRSISPKLSDCLLKFCYSCRGQKKDEFPNWVLEYCELYHELYSHESPSCPKGTEIRRRIRISKTKRSKNRESITLRQMHVDTILNCLETEKRRYSNLPVHERSKKEKPTRQRICKSYFERHTEELKKLQITSPRTLENLCSRKASGKHADEIRRQRNSIQACLPIDEPKLYSELNIRIQS